MKGLLFLPFELGEGLFADKTHRRRLWILFAIGDDPLRIARINLILPLTKDPNRWLPQETINRNAQIMCALVADCDDCGSCLRSIILGVELGFPLPHQRQIFTYRDCRITGTHLLYGRVKLEPNSWSCLCHVQSASEIPSCLRLRPSPCSSSRGLRKEVLTDNDPPALQQQVSFWGALLNLSAAADAWLNSLIDK